MSERKTITKAVKGFIEDANTSAGKRVHPKVLPHLAKNLEPSITYSLVSSDPKNTMGTGSKLYETTIQLDSWAMDYGIAEELHEELKDLFGDYIEPDETKKMNGVWVQTASIDNENDDYYPETKYYRFRLDIVIWWIREAT